MTRETARDLLIGGAMIIAGLAILSVLARACEASAQPGALDRSDQPTVEPRGADSADVSGPAASIESTLLARLRFSNGAYVRHCREARGGCEARVRRYSLLFVRAGLEAGVDPWLLAAMAFHESALNEDAVGAAGETGVLQLNPRGAAGRGVARECRRGPSYCADYHVAAAAMLLARSIAQCGNEACGLAIYNAGRASSEAGQRYARAVLRLRDEMRGAP